MASCTAEWLPSHTYCMITVSITHEWTEEKMRPLYMSCLYICAQFPQNFRDLETSVFCCYTNLLSSHDFSLIWMVPATDHAQCGQRQCSTQFFACSNCPRVHPFQPNAVCSTESAIFLWSSPIASNEMMQSVAVKAILFLASKIPICVSQA